MKQNLLKSISLTLLMLTATTAKAETQVSLPLSDKGGSVEGIITDGGKFRLSEIDGDILQKFKISADLFSDLSPAETIKFCKAYQVSKYPQGLNSPKGAFTVTGAAPSVLASLSALVGRPVETAINVVSLKTDVKFSDDAITPKAFPDSSDAEVRGLAISRLKISLDDAKAGKAIKADLTGMGTLACDLLLGTAKLTYQVLLQYPQAEAVVFEPIQGTDIVAISNVMSSAKWNGSVSENAVKAGVIVAKELNSKNIDVDMTEDHAAKDTSYRQKWTAQTVNTLVAGLTDAPSMKAKLVLGADADALALKMKELSYPLKGTLVRTDADFSVEGKK